MNSQLPEQADPPLIRINRSIRQYLKSSHLHNLPQKAIIIFGGAKSGKTSLLYYLNGWKLNRQSNQQLGIYYMVPETTIQQILIDPQNTSLLPNLSKLPDSDLCIIDVPDISGYSLKQVDLILAKISFKLLLDNITRIHLLFVISAETIESGDDLQHKIPQFLHLFQFPNESEDDILSSTSLILTKSEDDSSIDQIREKLAQIVSEHQLDQLTKKIYSNILTQQRIYQFANKQIEEENGQQLRKLIQNNSFVSFDLQLNLQNNDLYTQLQQQYISTINNIFNIFSTIIANANKSIHQQPNNKIQYLKFLNHFINQVHTLSTKNTTTFSLTSKVSKTIDQNYNKLRLILGQNINVNQKDQKLFDDILGIDNILNQISIQEDQLKTMLNQLQNSQGLGKSCIQDLLANQEINKICKTHKLKNILNTKKRIKKIGQQIKKSKLKPIKSYSQILNQYLENKFTMSIILQLPNRILKYDLLHRILSEKMKQKQEQRNFAEQQILIRSMTIILQKYLLYQQAIQLLMIIPDFNRISKLLNEAAQKDPDLALYQDNKLAIYHLDTEFVKQVYTFAKDNMRDDLASKCSQIFTFKISIEIKYLQQSQRKYIQALNSSFNDRLDAFEKKCQQCQVFMNMKNCKKALSSDERSRIVQQALDKENNSKIFNYKNGFNVEACQWLIKQYPFRK